MTTLLVTRPSGQAEELVSILADLNIGAISVPTVEIAPVADGGALDRALLSLDGAAWLVITSVNGAAAVGSRLATLGVSLPPGVRVAAVGAATAAALRVRGIRVDHVPERYLTAAIAAGLGDIAGRRVVVARADAATPHLPDALLGLGATVDDVVAYRTVEGPAAARDGVRRALGLPLDGLTFTSGSTVRGLCALLSPVDALRATALPAYCIGPVTADVARCSGFDVPVVASPHTSAALAAAIHRHLVRKGA